MRKENRRSVFGAEPEPKDVEMTNQNDDPSHEPISKEDMVPGSAGFEPLHSFNNNVGSEPSSFGGMPGSKLRASLEEVKLKEAPSDEPKSLPGAFAKPAQEEKGGFPFKGGVSSGSSLFGGTSGTAKTKTKKKWKRRI